MAEAEWMLTKKTGKIFQIIMNRPQKKNALSESMYRRLRDLLNTAAADKDTLLTVWTGTGDYFSSGNDLGNYNYKATNRTLEQVKKEANANLKSLVAAFIDHPKPLVALVNGPAVGIAVTVLGLCDLVYASDKATFHAPFTSLGLLPEGCSSVVFPFIMGAAKASEVLLFGKKLTAEEAERRGLVTAVFPDGTFRLETETRVKEFSELPPGSMMGSKKLIRDPIRQQLHDANLAETNALQQRFESKERMEAMANKFLSISNKSKI